jgi:hypothetical protein
MTIIIPEYIFDATFKSHNGEISVHADADVYRALSFSHPSTMMKTYEEKSPLEKILLGNTDLSAVDKSLLAYFTSTVELQVESDH